MTQEKLLFPFMWITKSLNLHEVCDWINPTTNSTVVTAQRWKYLLTRLIIPVMELVITGCYLWEDANEVCELFGQSQNIAFIQQCLAICENDDRQIRIVCGGGGDNEMNLKESKLYLWQSDSKFQRSFWCFILELKSNHRFRLIAVLALQVCLVV